MSTCGVDVVRSFALERTPFAKDIVTDSLLRTESFNDALGRLVHSVDNRLFCVLTAPAGCGRAGQRQTVA